MIGSGAGSPYCAAGEICRFGWRLLGYAGQAAAVSALVALVVILGLRGIYTELSFMLDKPNSK
jgi:hypothetical protein